MNSTDAIKDFTEKWCLKVIECMKGDDYILHAPDECLADLTALISEHYYPKEFTMWFRSDEFYNIFEESTDDIGITSWEYLPSGQVLYGLDEIHNYWKENEQ